MHDKFELAFWQGAAISGVTYHFEKVLYLM